MDGVPMDGVGAAAVEAFGARIRNSGPRTRVSLSILRGATELEVTAVLGRPRGALLNQLRLGRVNVAAATHRAQSRLEIWWHKYFLRNEAELPSEPTAAMEGDEDS
jgi:hypothetical protein